MARTSRARSRSWAVPSVVAALVVLAALAAASYTVAPAVRDQAPPVPHARLSAGAVPTSGPTLTWTNITTNSTSRPPPRESGGMVYDSTDGYVVMFGGELVGAPSVYYNDTWTFSAGVWTNVTSSVAPSPRFGFQIADDPADGVVVLFGGHGAHAGSAYLNDTWEYHAGTWTNVTKGTAPPGRFWGSMSYDSTTSTVILFGGNEGSAPAAEYSNDTWSFHAGTWTELSPSTSPPGRDGESQVNDPGADGVFVFGGLNSTGYLNDSWEYYSGTWWAVSPAKVPDSRTGAGLAYDVATGDVVMYGGFPANDYYYYTWVFADGAWSSTLTSATPPAGTIWGQIAYDAHDGYIVYFEGDGHDNSTWELTVTSGSPGSPLSVTASVAPTTGNAPLEVTVKADPSGGTAPYTYSWEFGDASRSATGNTTHTYDHVGTYQVNLTVNDSADHSISKSWTVTVQKASSGGNSSSTPPVSTTEVLGIVGAAIVVILALIFFGRRRRKPSTPPSPQQGTPPAPPSGSPPPGSP